MRTCDMWQFMWQSPSSESYTDYFAPHPPLNKRPRSFQCINSWDFRFQNNLEIFQNGEWGGIVSVCLNQQIAYGFIDIIRISTVKVYGTEWTVDLIIELFCDG